jgi:hypothetical protein
MDISIKNILGDEYPEIGVCTHGAGGFAQVFLFSYDGESVKQIYATDENLLDTVETVFHSIDLVFADQDTFPDILLGVSHPYQNAILLEYQPITAIHDQTSQLQITAQLTINQNLQNNNIKIKYTINNNNNIMLDIYNMHGKKVRSLINNHHNAGSYEVVWDGRGGTSTKVGNGCYLVRLVSGKSEVVKRVFLSN